MAFSLMAFRSSRAAACAFVALLLVSVSDILARTAKDTKHTKPGGEPLTADSIENAQWSANLPVGKTSPIVLKAEVLLERARFSPGDIDGRDGENFRKALRAYQQENGLNPTGRLDQATWHALVNTSDQSVMRPYTISASDEQGPFVEKIPQQFDQMAKLKRLSYRSPRQLLAEKFHMSE